MSTLYNSKIANYRSSRPEVFFKKGLRRNFAKFTGKRLCLSFFFNKVAGLRPATFLKKRLCHRSCPVNFTKFLKAPFLKEHLWWLLLTVLKFTKQKQKQTRNKTTIKKTVMESRFYLKWSHQVLNIKTELCNDAFWEFL